MRCTCMSCRLSAWGRGGGCCFPCRWRLSACSCHRRCCRAMSAMYILLFPPAVMRRRARLSPFGESVYVRLLPKLQFWLAGSNHYESPRGRLWACDGRKERICYSQYGHVLGNCFLRLDVPLIFTGISCFRSLV